MTGKASEARTARTGMEPRSVGWSLDLSIDTGWTHLYQWVSTLDP